MSTTESVQSHVDQLIARVEEDLDRRGILYICRAKTLLDAVKRGQLAMTLCEQTTPNVFGVLGTRPIFGSFRRAPAHQLVLF